MWTHIETTIYESLWTHIETTIYESLWTHIETTIYESLWTHIETTIYESLWTHIETTIYESYFWNILSWKSYTFVQIGIYAICMNILVDIIILYFHLGSLWVFLLTFVGILCERINARYLDKPCRYKVKLEIRCLSCGRTHSCSV